MGRWAGQGQRQFWLKTLPPPPYERGGTFWSLRPVQGEISGVGTDWSLGVAGLREVWMRCRSCFF